MEDIINKLVQTVRILSLQGIELVNEDIERVGQAQLKKNRR